MSPSRQERGRSLPGTRRQEALDEVLLHNSWFLTQVLNAKETIMIVPRYRLDYRDDYLWTSGDFVSCSGFISS